MSYDKVTSTSHIKKSCKSRGYPLEHLVRDVHALANRAIISEFDYFVAKFANLVCLNKFFFDVSVNLSISQLVNLSISQLVN